MKFNVSSEGILSGSQLIDIVAQNTKLNLYRLAIVKNPMVLFGLCYTSGTGSVIWKCYSIIPFENGISSGHVL